MCNDIGLSSIPFVNSNIVFEESQEPTSFFPPVSKSRGNPMAMDLARNSSTKQIRKSTVLQGLLTYSFYLYYKMLITL